MLWKVVVVFARRTDLLIVWVFNIFSCFHVFVTAILAIKAYVEMFEGKMKKQTVNYKNFKHSTHAAIVLILLTTIAFNVALWPHYGWNSPVLLGVCFFGMIVQFLVIVPTTFQNAVAFVSLTYFLQQYQ